MPQARRRHQPRTASKATKIPINPKTMLSQTIERKATAEAMKKSKAVTARITRPFLSMLGSKNRFTANTLLKIPHLANGIAPWSNSFLWLIRIRPLFRGSGAHPNR